MNHCCETFPKILGVFNWFTTADEAEPKSYVMPNIRTTEAAWRINYCPSCGKEVRAIEVTQQEIQKSREQLV